MILPTQPEQTNAIKLFCSPGIGNRKLLKILATPYLNSWSSLQTWCQQELKLALQPDLNKVELIQKWLAQDTQRHHLICYSSQALELASPNIDHETRQHLYPNNLANIHNPPAILFGQGNIELLVNKPKRLAIVGSRAGSNYGLKTAFQLAQALAAQGYCIVSGLAPGIDTAAHQGALASQQDASTIAILGNGLLDSYPRINQSLRAKIIHNQGLILSEFDLNTKPLPRNFVQRNRIISGLSLGVIVAAAKLASGSLITAKYALEQGREIFAIPGPIDTDSHTGCHQLIKDGAKLVAELADIDAELSLLNKELQNNSEILPKPRKELQLPSKKLQPPSKELQKAKAKLQEPNEKILDLLDKYTILSLDEILISTNYSLEDLSQILLELELRQQIILVPGGYQKK